MLEPKQIEIDGYKFTINPLRGFKVIRLDKQVVGLVLPIFKGIKEIKDLDSELNLDVDKIVTGLQDALASMDGDTFEKFLLELFSTTQITEPGKPPYEVDSTTVGNLGVPPLTLYKAMFEIMRYNKFTPFALGLGGNATKTINGLFSQTGNTEQK